MRRAYTPAHIHQRVARLRERLPDIALRTTFIVGFPGEGKEEFALLLRTMEELEFDWAVGFTYSAEEGSAAAQFEPRVPFREQRARLKELLILQREISARRNARWVGRELDVLVERVEGKGPLRAAGRSFRDAPEIDGTVIVRAAQPPPLDRFLRVRIEASDAYALRGEPVGAGPA
jgi:ribosomal protein S12 methylthiotransferase